MNRTRASLPWGMLCSLGRTRRLSRLYVPALPDVYTATAHLIDIYFSKLQSSFRCNLPQLQTLLQNYAYEMTRIIVVTVRLYELHSCQDANTGFVCAVVMSNSLRTHMAWHLQYEGSGFIDPLSMTASCFPSLPSPRMSNVTSLRPCS